MANPWVCTIRFTRWYLQSYIFICWCFLGCLRMYLNCQRKGPIGFGMKDDIGLFLRRKSSGSPISLDFSFGLKTWDGGKYYKVHRSHIFREAEKEFGAPSWITYACIEFSRSTRVLPSNSLTVLCTLRYFESEAEEDESKSYVSYICGFLLVRIIRWKWYFMNGVLALFILIFKIFVGLHLHSG